MSAFRAILGKDLRVELRTLESLPAMALFALTAYILFRFGLDRETLAGPLAAGVLLATVLFASLLAVNRIFLAELEQGGFDALRLAPVDGSSLFFAKLAALVTYLIALEAIALPAFSLLFSVEPPGLLPAAGVLLLVDVGVAATGTLVAAIATNSRARDLLAPLLLLPLLVPVMIGAAGALAPILAEGGPSFEGAGRWLAVLGVYDVIFVIIGYAVYDFLLED